jgi:DNA-binding transcriptional ArsR family regulator
MPNRKENNMNFPPASYQEQAAIFKALGHPSRLAMVHALGDQERCVCELQQIVGADISTVSKHLAILKHEGIVATRREGNQIFYRLRTPCILDIFTCLAALPSAESAEQKCSCSSSS